MPRNSPPEVNPEVPSLSSGAPGDWSSLMTDLHKSLTRAENELRLIHMNPRHKHLAKGYLTTSRVILKQLEDWCDED